MAAATQTRLRRSLAAALIIALTLAGLGRALAATATWAAGPGSDAAGLGVPICHSGADAAPDGPTQPVPHDCCDDGALLASAVLPAPPSVGGRVPVPRPVAYAGAAPWAPTVALPRAHRLPRGPPAA